MKHRQRNFKITKAVINGHQYRVVGDAYGLSRERVRQIFRKHLRKITQCFLSGSEYPCMHESALRMSLDCIRQNKDFWLKQVAKLERE